MAFDPTGIVPVEEEFDFDPTGIVPVEEEREPLFPEPSVEFDSTEIVEVPQADVEDDQETLIRSALIEKPLSQEEKSGVAERIVKGFGRGLITQNIDALGGAFAALGTIMGGTAQEAGRVAGETLRKTAKEIDEDYLKTVGDPTFVDDIAQGFGSAASFFIPGIGVAKATKALTAAPRLAKVLGLSYSAVSEAMVEGGAVYNEMIDRGNTPDEAASAAAKTFGLNIPVNLVLDKWVFSKFGEGGKRLTQILKNAPKEGAQEAIQATISQWAKKDPVLTTEFAKQALYEGLIGTVVGGGIAATKVGAEAIEEMRQPTETVKEQEIPAVEEDIAVQQEKRSRVLNALMTDLIEKGQATEESEASVRESLDKMDDNALDVFDKLHQENIRLQEETQELGELAYTDQLTKLKNRNYAIKEGLLQERIIRDEEGREVMEPVVPKQSAVIDIDYFGKVNKKFGEHRGDGVLRSLGTIVNEVMGEDVAHNIRYGGEEILIVPKVEMSNEQLGDKVQQIRDIFHAKDYGKGLKGLNITAGVNNTLTDAIMDMRAAKEAGRARTFIGGKIHGEAGTSLRADQISDAPTGVESGVRPDRERRTHPRGVVGETAIGRGEEVVTPTIEPQQEGETKEAWYDRFERSAKERLEKRGPRLLSGIPLDDLADHAIIGAAKIARGTVKFSKWSAEMVKEFGDTIRPHLRKLYQQSAAIIRKSISPKPKKAPKPKRPTLKQTIERATGVKKPEKKIEIEEGKALKTVLRAVSRHAKIVYKDARKELRREFMIKAKDKKLQLKELQDYARAYISISKLPTIDKTRMQSRAKDIKTKSGMWKLLGEIDQVEAKAGHSQAVTNLKKVLSSTGYKNLLPEFAEKVKPIVEGFSVTKPTPKTINRLHSLLDFVQKNPDNVIPNEILAQLNRLGATPVAEMKTETIQNLTDTINHYIHLSNLKNKLIQGKVRREKAEIVSEAKKNLAKKPERKAQGRTLDISIKAEKPKGFFGTVTSYMKNILGASSYNVELLSEIMDKSKHGIIKRTFYNGINEGQRETFRQEQELDDYLAENLKGMNLESWSEAFHKPGSKKVALIKVKLSSGKTIELTKAERMALYLHTLNESNLRHVLEGGISLTSSPEVVQEISGGDLEAIIDSMTDEEAKVARVIHDYLNTIQKENINKTSRQLTGGDIARVENYFPILTNALFQKISEQPRIDPFNSGSFQNRTLEGLGILKERVKSKQPIVLEDAFVALTRTSKLASSYSGLAIPVRNAKMLLADSGFRLELVKRYGRKYLNYLGTYIKDIEGTSTHTQDIDKLTSALINRMDIGILGLNPWVMLKQPVSLSLAANEINPKYLAKALKTIVSSEEIKKWSPELRNRFEGNISRELGEMASVGTTRQMITKKKTISQGIIMRGIAGFDAFAIRKIWAASKFEIEAKRPNLKGDAKMEAIARRAEEVIRLTQPTFNIKDRSEIGRSKSTFVRLATKYSSQRNKNYMIIRRAIEEYNTSDRGSKAKAQLLMKIGNVAVVNSVLIAGINALRNLVYGRYKDEPPEEKMNKEYRLALEAMKTAAGSAYFVGDIFSVIIDKWKKKGFGDYDYEDPFTSTVNDFTDAMGDYGKAFEQLAKEERYESGSEMGELKFKDSLKRALGRSGSITKFLGVPYHTVAGFYRAGAGWLGGREKQIFDTMTRNMNSPDWYKRNWFRKWWKKQDSGKKQKFTRHAYKQIGKKAVEALIGTETKPSITDAFSDYLKQRESYQKRRDNILSQYLEGEINKAQFQNRLKVINDDEKLFLKLMRQ